MSNNEKFYGFKDFANDYYQTLSERKRPNLCKLLWGVFFLGLLGFTGYMVYKLLHDYFQYGSYNTSKVSWTKNVTFPAITICSTNFINYTAFETETKTLGNTKIVEKFDDFIERVVNYDGKSDKDTWFFNKDFETLDEWERKIGSLYLRFGNGVPDLLPHVDYDYKFGGNSENINNFFNYSVATELGSCFKINDDSQLIQVTPGRNGGFSIDLNANIATYMETTSTRGFVVFLRNQEETVLLNQGGYVFAPGTETHVKLYPRSVKRLSKPWGTCRNVHSNYTASGSKYYQTVRECVQEKKIQMMFEECGCMPWYWVKKVRSINRTDLLDDAVKIIKSKQTLNRKKRDTEDEDATDEPIYKTTYNDYLCTYVAQQLCDYTIQDLLETYATSDKDTNNISVTTGCYEPCSFREWSVEMTSTPFPPTEAYFNKFMKFAKWIKPTPTYQYAQENIARLHIYYEKIRVTNVEQVKSYEIQSFIAEFGGTVDLFIGISFFTLFQLIEILVAFSLYKCCKNKKGISEDRSSEQWAIKNQKENRT